MENFEATKTCLSIMLSTINSNIHPCLFWPTYGMFRKAVNVFVKFSDKLSSAPIRKFYEELFTAWLRLRLGFWSDLAPAAYFWTTRYTNKQFPAKISFVLWD